MRGRTCSRGRACWCRGVTGGRRSIICRFRSSWRPNAWSSNFREPRLFQQECEGDGFPSLLLERGQVSGWRNTLSFLFGCLVTKFSPDVGAGLLQAVVNRMEIPEVDVSQRGQTGGFWNLAIVLGDCLEILVGRKSAVPPELREFFQDVVMRAIEQEIAVKDRHTLAVALGRLGDPRIVKDLRVHGHPDEHPGYVKIPAGDYYYGDDKERIHIDEPFWLSRYPVTNSQYAVFMDEKGYERREFWSEGGWRWREKERVLEPRFWRHPAFNASNQPVVGVSWWEAEAFTKWTGGKLPTERQWEAAARGPQGYVYPWGDEWEDGLCNSMEAGLGGTSAVGIFPRDRSMPFGVEDMAGNVWEWCADEVATVRVIRGGSWGCSARGCRAADRTRERAVRPGLRSRLSCGPSSVWRAGRFQQARANGAWSGGRGGGSAEPAPSRRNGRRSERQVEVEIGGAMA